jgi:hypothetical protein
VFCLLVACSASLPIVISPKQSSYYAAPSWPFYSLALALWCAPSVRSILAHLGTLPQFALSMLRVRVAALSAMGLTLVCSPLWYGAVFRDRELISDVDRIGQIVGRDSNLSVPAQIEHDWALRAYLYRWYYISLDGSTQDPPYRLDPSEAPRRVGPGDTLEARLERYQLSR